MHTYCEWREIADGDDLWFDTDCGQRWVYGEDEDFTYCPYCGHQINFYDLEEQENDALLAWGDAECDRMAGR